MPMKFGIQLPRGWPLATRSQDPGEAFEAMVGAACSLKCCRACWHGRE